MKETYTRMATMNRLRIRSANAFLQLARKYRAYFVVVKRDAQSHGRYDRASLDRFAESYEQFMQEKA